MLDAFNAVLEAWNPSRNHFRLYRIEAGTDLLGDWLVETTYGRIGTPGRAIRQAVTDEQAARKLVRQHLRRRATAPRRIGVPYRISEIHDPAGWIARHRPDSAARSPVP